MRVFPFSLMFVLLLVPACQSQPAPKAKPATASRSRFAVAAVAEFARSRGCFLSQEERGIGPCVPDIALLEDLDWRGSEPSADLALIVAEQPMVGGGFVSESFATREEAREVMQELGEKATAEVQAAERNSGKRLENADLLDVLRREIQTLNLKATKERHQTKVPPHEDGPERPEPVLCSTVVYTLEDVGGAPFFVKPFRTNLVRGFASQMEHESPEVARFEAAKKAREACYAHLTNDKPLEERATYLKKLGKRVSYSCVSSAFHSTPQSNCRSGTSWEVDLGKFQAWSYWNRSRPGSVVEGSTSYKWNTARESTPLLLSFFLDRVPKEPEGSPANP